MRRLAAKLERGVLEFSVLLLRRVLIRFYMTVNTIQYKMHGYLSSSGTRRSYNHAYMNAASCIDQSTFYHIHRGCQWLSPQCSSFMQSCSRLDSITMPLMR